MTLTVRPIYPHRKQIKTNYETQSHIDLVLNDEIELKNQLKKDIKRPEPT
jgi:hypothetical protein